MRWLLATMVLIVGGCHDHVPKDIRLLESKIGLPDKFYSVQALDQNTAVIVGYAGKILKTEDGGARGSDSWTVLPSGTRKALYDVEFVDRDRGWVVGQEGLILHTNDGGKSWQRQTSGTVLYLFAVDFVSETEGWAVGDKATYLHTSDGGKTWRAAQMKRGEDVSAEEALVAQDPVLYDVQFVDRKTGWIVGEFGKIYHTSNGGVTWVEQQNALLGDSGLFDVLDLPTFFGIHFIDSQNGVGVGLEGRVIRTRDGGNSWKFEGFDVAIPLNDPLYQPFQRPDTTAWAVGAAGEVVAQQEVNQAWRRVEVGMELRGWMRDIDFYDDKHGWIVGGYGLILRTTDGGKSWLRMLG